MREYCREHLTGYKRPQVIEFREELPKSNVGKILRRMLKEDARGDIENHANEPAD